MELIRGVTRCLSRDAIFSELRWTLRRSWPSRAAVPSFLCRAADCGGRRDDAGRRPILVVVQLAGGNDGLNTVVPYGDDAYGRNRPTLRLSAAKLHKIDDAARLPSGDAGPSSAVPGRPLERRAGRRLSEPQRVSTRWPCGSGRRPGPSEPTPKAAGWAGPWTSRDRPDDAEMPAMFVGQINRPFSLNAQQAIVPAIRGLDDCRLQPRPSDAGAGAAWRGGRVPPAVARTGSWISWSAARRRPTRPTAASRPLRDPARRGRRLSAVPAGRHAPHRRPTDPRRGRASASSSPSWAGKEPGGFDNHAAQRDNHAALLRQLSDSVAAFLDDLKRQRLLDRVVLMTFSEFGRTVAENGRRGTDHGAAAPDVPGRRPGPRRAGRPAPQPHRAGRRRPAASTPTSAASTPRCSTAGWAWTAGQCSAPDSSRWRSFEGRAI